MPNNIPNYVEGHELLKGKSVLITAAAGAGIGYATAKKAIEENCRKLYISDIHEKRLRQTITSLQQLNADIPVYGSIADVTSQQDVDNLIADAEQQLQYVDVLFNNAGLGGTTSLVDMTDDEWNKVIDVTLTGTMRMTRAMLSYMQQRQSGVIINNASVLGWRAQKQQSHYAAAKAGVMAFTRCSAMEAADYNVRINAVAPSIAFHDFLRKASSTELLDELASREAFGRAAEVWEVANIVVFLASDYSSYMTGEVVSVSSQHP